MLCYVCIIIASTVSNEHCFCCNWQRCITVILNWRKDRQLQLKCGAKSWINQQPNPKMKKYNEGLRTHLQCHRWVESCWNARHLARCIHLINKIHLCVVFVIVTDVDEFFLKFVSFLYRYYYLLLIWMLLSKIFIWILLVILWQCLSDVCVCGANSCRVCYCYRVRCLLFDIARHDVFRGFVFFL